MTEYRGLLVDAPGMLGQPPSITDPKPGLFGFGPSPNPFGASFGVLSPAEQAEVQPSALEELVSRVIHGAIRAAMVPGQVMQSTTPVTTEGLIKPALDMAGFMETGGIANAAPRAGEAILGSGSIRKPPAALPMDEASRLQRAREMGFGTDERVYHGGAGMDFRAFDPAKRGSMTGVPTAKQAEWTALIHQWRNSSLKRRRRKVVITHG